MQLVAAIVKTPDFSGLVFSLNGTPIGYGSFLGVAIDFLIVASMIYFFVVLPLKYLLAKAKGTEAAATKTCGECLSEIPLAARRCKFCAQPVTE